MPLTRLARLRGSRASARLATLSPYERGEGRQPRAGLRPEESAETDTPFVFADDNAACRAFMASGPGVVALRRNGEDKVRDAPMPALSPFKQADGSYRLENKFKFVLTSP